MKVDNGEVPSAIAFFSHSRAAACELGGFGMQGQM